MALVPLSTVVASARVEHAEEIAAVVARSGWLGRVADPDVLALIHAVLDDDRSGPAAGGWDRRGLYTFLRCGVFAWCRRHRCPLPPDLPETLWLWLHHRDATGGAPDDEPLHDLLKVLLCYGGLGLDGRPVPDDAPGVVACECSGSGRPSGSLPSGSLRSGG